MCGIAGIVDIQGNIRVADIREMTQSLRHRGPDGEGYFGWDPSGEWFIASGPDTPKAVLDASYPFCPRKPTDHFSDRSCSLLLGHRRLSVIDLSPAGHQPMCTPDERYWIVHNGEIYNYIEIREALKGEGVSFDTQTDTEVILKAYQQWGTECLAKFNGMWAFVIFDRQEQRLFGARDRFGVKPFYYYRDDRYFAFASEQKALLKLPYVEASINPKAVFDYFILGQLDMEPEGLFAGIHELPPAHSFTFDCRQQAFSTKRYYQLRGRLSFEPFDDQKARNYIAETREKVIEAIRLRLRSDVRVGSCLSGGLDSSTIVCVINDLIQAQDLEQVGDLQQVFTASFKEAHIDESPWAKIVADQTQTQWHQTFPDRQGLVDDLENLVYSQDVPVWSSSTYAQYRVMRLIPEKGVKVVLDGQGGDEMFAGYQQYYYQHWMDLLNNRRYGKLRQALDHNLRGNTGYLLRSWLKQFLFTKLPTNLRENIYKRLYPEYRYLHPDIWATYKSRLELLHPGPSKNLNQNLVDQFSQTLLKNLLKCEDRCSMRFSVESRTPFADDLPLIEYIFQIPSTYKIHGDRTKYLLREAMTGILPEKIRTRSDKMGYVTPNNQWLREMIPDIRGYFDKDLGDYLNMPLLQQSFDDLFDQPTDVENFRSWKFLNFAVWKKVFGL